MTIPGINEDAFAEPWIRALRPVERHKQHRAAQPTWLGFLIRSYSKADFPLPVQSSSATFAAAVAPLCGAALADVRRRIAAESGPVDQSTDTQRILEQLTAQLCLTLSSAAGKCLVTMMGALAESGSIPGKSAEARYKVFEAELHDPGFTLEILKRFPVLARRLSVMAMDWSQASAEFLGRLNADREALIGAGLISPHAGHLVDIKSVGDRHRGGRQGHLLHFESGDRLVYKPRPVDPEAGYNHLLAWIAGRAPRLAIRRYSVLPRDGYGWVEFVARKDCADEADVQQFYFRQGVHLGLLHILRGTDMHHENIIAHGADPLLVDLETLFHPCESRPDRASATMRVRHHLAASVRRTHLLPTSPLGAADNDVGGLGLSSGHDRQIEGFAWVEKGSDAMRMAKLAKTLEAEPNLPTLKGRRMDARPHAERVIEGFSETLRLLRSSDSLLLADDGPIGRMKTMPCRIIMRGTEQYSKILFDSLDPDLCQDADALEDYLSGALEADLPRRGHLADVIAHEMNELWRGDIPYFQKTVGERPVVAADGAAVGSLNLTVAWDDCVALLGARAPEDDAAQIRIARWSLYDHTSASRDLPISETTSAALAQALHDPLAVARGLADEMLQRSFSSGSHASWLSVSDAVDGRFKAKPAGYDLYSGLSGIALAYLYLGKVCDDATYTRVAEAALNEAVRMVRDDAQRLSLGAFDGVGGLIYTLAHAGSLLPGSDWLDQACDLLVSMEELIAQQTQVDVISGHAGFVASLVALSAVHSDPSVIGMAQASSRTLVELAVNDADRNALPTLKPVSFSHGWSGIGWALLTLGQTTDDRELVTLGEDLMLRDIAAWCPGLSEGNALNRVLEDIEHGDNHMAWCSGPLGILLALIRRQPEMKAREFHAAAGALCRALEPGACRGRFGLCHGDFGNVELIDEVVRQGLPQESRLASFRDGMLSRLCAPDAKADLSIALDCPGLMTGHAGLVFGLLRLTAPDVVPSVLTLEPPVLAQAD